MRNPNGFGSVSKMSGKRRKPWRVRVTIGWSDDGKQIYKNLGTYTTRKEAMEALTNWNVEPISKTDKIKRDEAKNKMTFADMYNAMMKYREDKMSDSMKSNNRTAFLNLQELHQQTFDRLRKPQLQDAFDHCTKSTSTKNKMKTLLSAVYKYAIEHELAETDYSKMLDMDTNKNERDYKPFSEEEIETIWEHVKAGDRIAKLIILQIYTGTRINELLTIKKENVHLDKSYMIGGFKTEAGTDRIIPLHKRIIPIIQEFYDMPYPFMFPNSKGTQTRYSGFIDQFHKRMEDWKMEHLPHDARRTMATRLHVADVPYNTVKQILGHSQKTDVTNRYIFKDVKHLVKWVNVIK